MLALLVTLLLQVEKPYLLLAALREPVPRGVLEQVVCSSLSHHRSRCCDTPTPPD